MLEGHQDRYTSFGVTTGSWQCRIYAETPKISNLDPLTTSKRVLHRGDDQGNCRASIIFRQSREALRKALVEIGLQDTQSISNAARTRASLT